MNQPSGLRNMLRAAAGALPFVPARRHAARPHADRRGPAHRPANVAAYANVTGLRFGNRVPLTYPFALTFPTVMSLVTGFDFPFAAMGSVHVENHITQYRPIAVTDTVGVRVHAENLREHRKGLLVDLVTDVKRRQRHRLASGDDVPAPAAHQPVRRAEAAAAEAAQAGAAERGAAHHARARSGTTPSVGGRPQPDPHQPDRGQAVRLPDRHRTRNVQRRSGIWPTSRDSFPTR